MVSAIISGEARTSAQDTAVAGRGGRECVRGQHREADDDTTGDDGQPCPMDAGGQALPRQAQRGHGQKRGNHGASRTDEHRGQAADGDAGEDDGEREGRHAQQTPPQSRMG